LEVVILLLLTLQSIPNVALTGTFQSPRVKESSGTDDSTFVLTGEADRRGRGPIHTVRCPD